MFLWLKARLYGTCPDCGNGWWQGPGCFITPSRSDLCDCCLNDYHKGARTK